MTEPEKQVFEYVFEQEVRAEKVDRFYALSDKLHALAERQPGFIHQERRQVSNEGPIWRFQTIVKFDTAEHCISWLDKPERRKLLNLEEEEADFSFEGHGNWKGYARWLSRSIRTEPPKWKVNVLVLLTLYPTVMVLTPLLHLTMKGFSFPIVMLVSNSICVAATSWVLVPFVSRFYLRWLEGEKGVAGMVAAGSLLALFVILVLLFISLPVSVWG